jgi:hypothetical protein
MYAAQRCRTVTWHLLVLKDMYSLSGIRQPVLPGGDLRFVKRI